MQQTLFFPLLARAQETESRRPLLRDPKAVELVRAIDFDPATFKVGDMVSYRVPSQFQDFPFVGVLLEVHEDHVILASDPKDPTERTQSMTEVIASVPCLSGKERLISSSCLASTRPRAGMARQLIHPVCRAGTPIISA